jgi:hypothetical protein
MDAGMVGAGIVAERFMVGTEIGVLWAEAERLSGTRTVRARAGADKSVRPTGLHPTGVCPTHTGEGARATQPKRLGEMAEAAFLAKASRMRFGVACPWGDSERYDFIVDVSGRLWRVQVKSAHRAGQDGCYSFRLHGSSLAAYRADEVDVVVAYVVPDDVWYVFPVRELRGIRSLKIFSGSRRKRSKFERFREAWWVMESQ